MIINYDRNPALSTDAKLQSLIESLQLAIDEVKQEMASIEKKLKELEERAD